MSSSDEVDEGEGQGDSDGQEKAAERRRALARREAAHTSGVDEAANEHLYLHLTSLVEVNAGPPLVVSAYMPIRTELNPLPTMRRLVDNGHTVCVPVISASGHPLDFAEWSPDALMVDGPFGAAVPAELRLVEPEIVVTPLLAFDRRGYRLGYGGGFYDRTLTGLRVRGLGYAVGFAYAAQEIHVVPIDEYDAPLDAIVTEHGAVKLSKAR